MESCLNLVQDVLCDSTNPCPVLYNCIDGACVHKDIFPMTQRELFGSVLAIFLVGMANTGGLGGAFISSPILMIIFNYDPLPAIRIVYCMTFGGAIGSFLHSVTGKRKNSQKPLIDYDLALICTPMLVAGASIGVLLNSFLPPFLTLGCLVYLMVQSLKKIYRNARIQREKENKPPQQQENPGVELRENSRQRLNSEYREYLSVIHHPELQLIQMEEAMQFPWQKYREFIILLIIMMGLFVIKGTRTFSSLIGIEYCSLSYWLFYAMSIVVCLYFGKKDEKLVAEAQEIKQHALLEEPPYIREQAENQSFLTPENSKYMSKISFISGILAGMLGIGGGVIMNPIMMEIGVSGEVATATSGLFVLFTSFISMFQTIMTGGVQLKTALYFGPLAFFGALGVSMYLKYLVNKYKRPSLILYALVFITLVGTIVVPLFAIQRSISNPSVMFKFGSFC